MGQRAPVVGSRRLLAPVAEEKVGNGPLYTSGMRLISLRTRSASTVSRCTAPDPQAGMVRAVTPEPQIFPATVSAGIVAGRPDQ